ncbi:E3 ubiquitin-protein ligase TRIM36 [Octopus bimaculoides]|uniref:RING-type domain-containing protein n=1 Tax=Octopus bimaculoides TaxID=37653 RepID=A0A0L8G6D9_OCTBM|nr:E3 ubiquitin-protein ligase TRIM36 [Octopus bimaculoides]|eukprot:XP_014783790.1 PREDICTED: E3 ubiquitin-protein ligase TRIM36-like [Octopus bimaculoides]
MAGLEQDLTCSMCFELFTNPKALPCLHTFCQDCLHQYIMNKEDCVRQTGHLTCPICRSASKPPEPIDPDPGKWAQSFSSNHLITSLLDRYAAQRNHQPETSDNLRDVPEVVCSCTKNPAVRWCEQCSYPLCNVCESEHDKYHVIVDMTSKHVNNTSGAESKLENSCPKHPDKNQNLYCLKCSAFCCDKCASVDHEFCEKVYPLKLAVENKLQLGQVYNSILSLQKDNINYLRELITKKLDKNKSHGDTLKQGIQSIRIRVNKLLLEQEEKLLDQVHTNSLIKINLLKKIQEDCDNSIEMLNTKVEVINSALSVKNSQEREFLKIWDDVSSFMTKNTSQHREIKTKLENIHISDIHFEPGAAVWDILRHTSNLGKLTDSTQSDIFTHEVFSPTRKLSSTRRLSFRYSTNLLMDSELSVHLTGICVTAQDSVVVSDYTNRKLKMITKDNHLTCCELMSGPYGIDYIASLSEVVVTLPDILKIAFVSETMTLKKQLSVAKAYWAVAYDESKMTLVCCSSNPPAIDILYDGVLIKTIGFENERRPLFCEPEYITVSCHQKFIVSDWKKKSLFCCDKSGRVSSAFIGDYGVNQLQCPLGVTLDADGFIYLADKDSNRIYKFTPEMTFDSIYLSDEDEIEQPVSLAFNSVGQLFVIEIPGLLKFYG